MSRIGKLPIIIPAGVTINVANDNTVTVKGKLGELKHKVDPDIQVKIEGQTLSVIRPTEQKRHKSLHGLTRTLINNMVVGVSDGYEIKQELVGVGYRATSTGQMLELVLGYSHSIHFEMPAEIKVECITEKRGNPFISLKSIDKQLIGQIAAKIRSFRPPEPYKGKGIKFVGEVLRRKAGKQASSSK